MEDKDWVDIEDEHALQYWATRFAVEPDLVLYAVNQVGPIAKDVERKLKGETLTLDQVRTAGRSSTR